MNCKLLIFFLFSLLLVGQFEARVVAKQQESSAVELKAILDNAALINEMYKMKPEKKTYKFDLTPNANRLLKNRLAARKQKASL